MRASKRLRSQIMSSQTKFINFRSLLLLLPYSQDLEYSDLEI